jgi:xanthine dehydrogenase accessory factor
MFVEPLVPSDELIQLCRGVAQAIDARVEGSVTTALDWSDGPKKVAKAGNKTWRVGAAASSDAFTEPLQRLPRLIVFGAGHVGAEIARAAARCDFHVVVIDDREDFANAERLPFAHQVIAEDFRAVLNNLTIDADDFVIAATRGHGHDALIVERLAPSQARYVGMLGSKRKQAVIWKALERAGVPREKLDRVKVPIGENIGADTPAEIAVSVLAELIRLRRGG